MWGEHGDGREACSFSLKTATYFAGEDFPEFTDSVGVALSPLTFGVKKSDSFIPSPEHTLDASGEGFWVWLILSLGQVMQNLHKP